MKWNICNVAISLYILSLMSCTHPDIGGTKIPNHSLNNWGFKQIDMDPLILKVEYTTTANEITFDGNVECKNYDGNVGAASASTGWGTAEEAVLTLTFFFLDSSDKIVGRETETLMDTREICMPRHFKVTFPYNNTYKSVAYRGQVKLGIM